MLAAVDRKGNRVKVNDLTARRVWVAAGGRCTFCKEFLAEDATTGQSVFTGQLAHIVGATNDDGSPRHASPKSMTQRALAENLLLLCGSEHKVVDSFEHWTTYSEEMLLAFKEQHERDIRELTGLLRKPKSTVVRVTGDVRGQAADFSKQAVIRAMLEEQRFPDFSLHDESRNCEVDLRHHDGEEDSHGTYWDSTTLTLKRRLAPLSNHLRTKEIDHISVFALARIPLLVQLGALLDDVTNVTVYSRRRGSGGGWGWDERGRTDQLEFSVTSIPGDGDPVVTISLSGPVDIDALPADLQSRPRYDLKAVGVPLRPTVLRSAEDLDAFTDSWRELLATLETNHRNQQISLALAVPAAAAVEIGRAHMKAAHAPLHVFDRIGNTYALAVEVS